MVRIVELIGGGCAVTFLRGADPPGPYYAASVKQAWKHAGRWMKSREDRLHGPPESYGGVHLSTREK
ncbi:MAG TPA: hypothetical protein VGU03_10775 [Frateuria sp.]|uniref:hypothetical protein n=1 Tax=Frateuria sp. TaxID=2211372 RepID=UPI002DE64F65|nr:hypothetical protein [Frateuria sp.]